MTKSKNEKKSESTQNRSIQKKAASSIISGRTSGDSGCYNLDQDSRKVLVEFLNAQGHSTVEIAAQLEVNPRTIRRDLAGIRAAYAVERDPQTIKEIVGGLIWQKEVAIDRIRSAVLSKDAKVSERIKAQVACWKIEKDHLQILQRLGYLPIASDQSSGDKTRRNS